jgi:hypothetical protein
MADVNKTIEISYTANIGALERALKRIPGITETQMKKAINEVEKELKQFEKASAKSAKSFNQKFSGMAGGAKNASAAIAGASVAMLAFGQQLADATNDLVDTSTKTGIAADTLQGLRIAAEGSGLAFESFIGPLQKLQFFMVEANNENKNAIELFDRMGVEIKNTNGSLKDADTVFREMMESLSTMDSDLERNTLLMKLFGEQGAMFAQSGVVGALDEFVELGREFGVDVGPEAVKQAADFQRAMADLKTVGTGAMEDILMVITDSDGLSAAIDQVTASVITMKEIFVAAFEVMSIPTQHLFHHLTAIGLALSGDFQGAMQEFEQSFDHIESAALGVVGLVDNVERQLVTLRKARQAIRGDDGDGDNGTAQRKKNTEEETQAVENLIEIRKDDLDIIGGLFDAQKRLQEISDGFYEDQLSGEEKLQQAHEQRLERIDDLVFAESEAIKIRGSELQTALDQNLISEEEYTQRRLDMVHELKNVYQSANDARMHSENQLHKDLRMLDNETTQFMQEQTMGKIENWIQLAMGFSSVMLDISNAFIGLQETHFEAFEKQQQESLDRATKRIETFERDGVLTAEQAATQKANLEQQYTKKIEKEYMRIFKIKQATAITEIIIDGAQAMARAYKDFPGITAPAMAAFVGAKVGLQLATVMNQPPPKFDVGGMVGQSDPLAPDQTQAQLLTGEAVLDRSTVQKLGGEQGIRDLQNTSRSQVVVIQPFKHFDRFMSTAKKRGRFGTKRASSRY